MNICKTCQQPYSSRGRFYCSRVCLDLNPEVRKQRSDAKIGKAQTPEHIRKRVLNTDQVTKEATRKKTSIERFGVANPVQTFEVAQKISSANTGKAQPRSPEHQQRIVDSRRKNGTLAHTSLTKQKISHGIKAHYQGPNPSSPIATRGRSKNQSGLIGEIWYRSSYERKFLEYCQANNIKVRTASTSEFRVRYELNGKFHFYYPDFYLEDFDLVLEVKAGWQLVDDRTQAKWIAAFETYNFKMIDEEELDDLDYFFTDLTL